MMRPNQFARWTMGSIALLALAAGCSKQQQQPASPPFESEVSETRAYGPGAPGAQGQAGAEQGGAQPGAQPMQPGAQPGMQPGGQERMTEPPSGMGAMPPAPPPSGPDPGAPPSGTPEAAAMSERAMCDALMQGAAITVEDTEGGVVIAIKPGPEGSMESVRKSAQQITTAWPSGGAAASSVPAAERCALFDMGRQGAMATMSETPEMVRIRVTTTDQAAVRDLRKQARDFAKSAKRGTKG